MMQQAIFPSSIMKIEALRLISRSFYGIIQLQSAEAEKLNNTYDLENRSFQRRWNKFNKIYLAVGLILIILLTLLLTDKFRGFKTLHTLISPVNIHISPTPTIFHPKKINLEKIFDDDRAFIATLSAEKTITLFATGDVIPARSVNYQTATRKDFAWAFKNTAEYLKSGDLTLINLETPLLKNCSITQTGMNFCGDPKHIEGLILAGVDIANIANNHAGNKGSKGIEETVNLLSENNILISGDGNILYKTIKGMKFAFLGYNDIEKPGNPSPAEDAVISKQIKEAKVNSDVVIVSFSWGDEYTPQPNARQKYLAHLTIENGADLIIGNHPHWIQPVEIYKDKLIVYAHGNFIFDQMWSEKTKEGVVGKYTFYENKLIDVIFTPIKIRNYGEAYFPDERESKRIIKEMEMETFKLKQNNQLME
jgi:poly-gamma-glutamate capsule biosynthesis protein CapA/YwtB (metallophosphatase superfamily)